VVVFASTWRDPSTFDAAQPFPVVRYPHSVMLPTPDVARRAQALLREHGCDSVLFGAAAPLGLLGPGLRRAGARRIVALTHGHEAAWAMLPGARQLLHRIGDGVDVVTYLGEYTRSRIASALSPSAAARMERLAPGVDDAVFHPGAGGAAVCERYGLADRPVVVCVSRLMPRKGQDTLIRALPQIRSQVPGVALLLVGGGPSRERLERLARDVGVERDVVFTGSVPFEELPAHYDAGDVFAMPCRTRNRGLDVEGLGIVYLEASATGKPVVAGDSGGAPDAVLEGETGFVVPGRDVSAVAGRVIQLLLDPGLAAPMGKRGRAWVEASWGWETVSRQLSRMLGDGRL
jgi:phosphatidylinositol alpha-1,6-mannosyltransferase